MPPRNSPRLTILELSNIVVTIRNAAKEDSEHNALVAYKFNEETDDNEVVCWVPAIPGHRFCIHIGYDGDSLPYRNAGLDVSVYIDGVGPVADTFVKPRDILKRIEQRAKGKPITVGEMEITGQELKNGYIRPLCFSLRQTVETGEL
ncbi:hypothetical protein FRC08_007644, partial [Ceratobasidium sp. 394]